MVPSPLSLIRYSERINKNLKGVSWTYDTPFLFQNFKVLELNPGQLLPYSLERTMGMVLEPEVGEEALYYHHGNTHKEGIGDAELRLEIEAIISKQSATDDRLEKVVGQTHLTKLAQERQSLSEPFLTIPQQYES